MIQVSLPATLFTHDILSSSSISNLPLIDELTNVSYFSCHWWNSKLSKGPVILVTADGYTHSVFGRSCQSSFREWRIFGDFCENWQDSWSSLIDVIFLSTVEWVDKGITIRVSVDNEI